MISHGHPMAIILSTSKNLPTLLILTPRAQDVIQIEIQSELQIRFSSF